MDEEAENDAKQEWADEEEDPQKKGESGKFRCCCRFNGSCCSAASIVILHVLILSVAIMCMVPAGVMTSVMRAWMSGIVTFVWLVYCCVLVFGNILAVAIGRFRGEGNEAEEEGEHADAAREPSYGCCTATCLWRAGCLCVGPRGDDSDDGSRCYSGTRLSIIFAVLLVVEGVMLLTPVWAAAPAYNSLTDGEVEAKFPGGEGQARFSQAFAFNKYMVPGGFSIFGGYDNSNNEKMAMTRKYKDGCRPECELDVHLPASAVPLADKAGFPVIFHVHGGGWDSGEKSNPMTPIGYWLELGYAFVSVQYRFPSMTPGGATIYEQLNDVQDAWEYVKANWGSLGVDPSMAVFVGDSAGGHLACTVAYRLGDASIRGIFNLFGATEWEFYMKEGGGILEDFFNEVLPPDLSDEELQDIYKNTSCSTHATVKSPPILTVHGNWDTIVPISLSKHLHNVLDGLNVSNLLVEVPLAEHGLDVGWFSVGGQMTRFAMERFVAAQFS